MRAITLLDQHGQAFSPAMHFGRICRERPHEFNGLLRGILADGEINAGEASVLIDWMRANADYLGDWPYDVIFDRFAAAMADGQIDHEEHLELLKLVSAHLGAGLLADGRSASSELLCDDPVPMLDFVGRTFVITGVFLCGKRKEIEAVVERLGGKIGGSVTGKTNYLLIGAAGSRDWLLSNHGTKILDAVDRKRAGQGIGVVSERHFKLQLESRFVEGGG